MTRFLQRKADGSTQGLGSFKIEGHPSQIEAADALRKHFVHHQGEPVIQEMSKLMHSAFVALLCPPRLKDSPIACPTDQTLLLLALVGPGSFTPASSIMYHCAGLQYTFRCIMVHIARLKSSGLDEYQPWISTDHDGLGEAEDRDVEAANVDLDDSDSGYEGTDSELPSGKMVLHQNTVINDNLAYFLVPKLNETPKFSDQVTM